MNKQAHWKKILSMLAVKPCHSSDFNRECPGRYGARIWELIEKGYNITSVWEQPGKRWTWHRDEK